jgi:protein ImuA
MVQATAIRQLRTLGDSLKLAAAPRIFRTGLDELNALAPGGTFQCGAVHELLWRPRGISPKSFALLLAKSAQAEGGAIVWSDPRRELHPPALSAAGIDLRHLILLRCAKRSEELWALAECLRCRGVSATVAAVQHLSRIEARRLQLAAERGGGIGLFMRPFTLATNAHYAAATRWLVQAAPADQGIQRWSVELLHGHGGRIGQVLLLEVDRETYAMRASAPLADRSVAPASARATA